MSKHLTPDESSTLGLIGLLLREKRTYCKPIKAMIAELALEGSDAHRIACAMALMAGCTPEDCESSTDEYDDAIVEVAAEILERSSATYERAALSTG